MTPSSKIDSSSKKISKKRLTIDSTYKKSLFIYGNCVYKRSNTIIQPYEKVEGLPDFIEIKSCILDNLNDLIPNYKFESKKLIVMYNAIANTIKNKKTVLGKGNFNDVYLIEKEENENLKEDVVLRLCKSDKAEMGKQNEYRSGFIQAYLSSKLDRTCQAYIPKVYAIGMYDNRPFQVMEHGGEMLTNYLKKTEDNKIGKNEICKLANAIQCLHNHDFVHRDIKPDNISIKGDQLFLLDFGFTQHKDHIKMTMGTRSYMPEKILKKDEKKSFLSCAHRMIHFPMIKLWDIYAFCIIAEKMADIQIKNDSDELFKTVINEIVDNNCKRIEASRSKQSSTTNQSSIRPFSKEDVETIIEEKSLTFDSVIKNLECSSSLGGQTRNTRKRRRARKNHNHKNTTRKQ